MPPKQRNAEPTTPVPQEPQPVPPAKGARDFMGNLVVDNS